LKNIDGASHEFYQRSHDSNVNNNRSGANEDEDDEEFNDTTTATGRAERTAGRIGACADALFGCELLDHAFVHSQLYSSHTSTCSTRSNTHDDDEENNEENDNGKEDGDIMEQELQDRKVIFSATIGGAENEDHDHDHDNDNGNSIPLHIVVMYEEDYNGGAGIDHGGINSIIMNDEEENESAENSRSRRGRYLIMIKDAYENEMESSLQVLDEEPIFVELSLGLISGEVACVNPKIYRSAAKILTLLQEKNVFGSRSSSTNEDVEETEQENEDSKDNHNTGDEDKGDEIIQESKVQKEVPIESSPAIHFIGRSIAGGVASLSALMLDGSIPMPTKSERKKRRKRTRGHNKKKSSSTLSPSSRNDDELTKKRSCRTSKQSQPSLASSSASSTSVSTSQTLHGFGKSRTSALVLGAPPSISANIKATYITSIMYGDDIICRTTHESLNQLRQRVYRISKRNMLTKQIGWMTDTLSLTVSSIKSHAHGSEGEEGRLSTPGKAYLLRPRRIKGGVSSIHEIGNASGREALRAAVLWQLNDILLSRSMWKHHSFESYIYGLDKVQLRQVASGEEEEDAEE
jgi:hypothetical protein